MVRFRPVKTGRSEDYSFARWAGLRAKVLIGGPERRLQFDRWAGVRAKVLIGRPG